MRRSSSPRTLQPTCDGKPFRAGHSPRALLQAEFLRIYTALNRLALALADLRRRQPKTAALTRAERRLLTRIEQALLDKEALENRCAGRGIWAQPTYAGGFASDLAFTFPTPAAPHLASSSAFITLPAPRGVRPVRHYRIRCAA